MDSHLVPDMLNRVHIEAFAWSVRDLYVLIFVKTRVARVLCGGAIS